MAKFKIVKVEVVHTSFICVPAVAGPGASTEEIVKKNLAKNPHYYDMAQDHSQSKITVNEISEFDSAEDKSPEAAQ